MLPECASTSRARSADWRRQSQTARLRPHVHALAVDEAGGALPESVDVEALLTQALSAPEAWQAGGEDGIVLTRNGRHEAPTGSNQ